MGPYGNLITTWNLTAAKNNSPQFNVSLRFIRVFILVPLLERFSYDLEIKTRKQNRKKTKERK